MSWLTECRLIRALFTQLRFAEFAPDYHRGHRSASVIRAFPFKLKSRADGIVEVFDILRVVAVLLAPLVIEPVGCGGPHFKSLAHLEPCFNELSDSIRISSILLDGPLHCLRLFQSMFAEFPIPFQAPVENAGQVLLSAKPESVMFFDTKSSSKPMLQAFCHNKGLSRESPVG